MGVSERDAVQIAERYLGGEYYTRPGVIDYLPANCAPYNLELDPMEEYWFVFGNKGVSHMLTSSRLIVVSQRTGKVVFDGSAGDEG